VPHFRSEGSVATFVENPPILLELPIPGDLFCYRGLHAVLSDTIEIEIEVWYRLYCPEMLPPVSMKGPVVQLYYNFHPFGCFYYDNETEEFYFQKRKESCRSNA